MASIRNIDWTVVGLITGIAVAVSWFFAFAAVVVQVLA